MIANTASFMVKMKCNNTKTGCYHEKDIHEDGNGTCLVKGCKCDKYKK